MEVQIGGGLELIFLDQVSRFEIGACLGGGLKLSKSLNPPPIRPLPLQL